ncbi:hypothetical protein I7I53_08419 [Histoplasma capsulatum var. duboisii H88]|uniref:Uncharacterized protein n=1 Tax=Ajellomyces capsulatus (strain H88) TaxID=544711 RepID=A0A8A1LJ84_AJEC8|nr:hypothetical protein I7I53_08419 [Histoplasma capsulatum var. duboisii H88]
MDNLVVIVLSYHKFSILKLSETGSSALTNGIYFPTTPRKIRWPSRLEIILYMEGTVKEMQNYMKLQHFVAISISTSSLTAFILELSALQSHIVRQLTSSIDTLLLSLTRISSFLRSLTTCLSTS